ncbi:MAG TPA: twitching motility protein PilT [Balneola sp.]|jgi:twitching motility protein PilT|nr:twitching motility protein PilT [Bacteroidota bacterium]MAC04206.1 twitching motility protein PilT [Balneola sp.]MAO78221.1 twitching motility protein PilT [Balneola sp.]MBF64222.1 twitching motility protein PilT [Balneola sp.]HAW80029.1 twitching motility protein PilT [Balneola sp.]|tara:strand:+ start:50444 stop:51688 length:1245 start_codon:yes stop_codon:yes gene_type:complete
MQTASKEHILNTLTAPLIEQIPFTARGDELFIKMSEILDAQPEKLRIDLKAVLDSFLLKMLKNEASDIDLGGAGCSGKVWYRIFGDKSPDNRAQNFAVEATDFLLLNILVSSQRKLLLRDRNLDFSYGIEIGDGKKQRFRVDIYFDLEHLAMNMRRIDNTIRPFKSLGVNSEVAKALSLKYYKYGLSLITGITGSGKSSTLDTIIDANNRTVDSHIVVISSPVELIHKPIKSVVRHREVGRDVESFKAGAIQALRQDPDIIVIGELRDPETIMTALEITDSGHKTFSTLHTSSAMDSIERILGEVPTEEQNRVRARLADVLTCVISQKLVPSLDGKRVLAKEVLIANSSVKAAIRNNNISEIYQMLMEGSERGMNTLEQDLKRLFVEGKISKENAINYSNNKSKIVQLLSETSY